MNAVDTNILFYAHDSKEINKQKTASDLIALLDDGVLVWQVACEYLWVSRKLEPQGYSYADAIEDVLAMCSALPLPPVDPGAGLPFP
jgi:predicted nucleic acid-binding protein